VHGDLMPEIKLHTLHHHQILMRKNKKTLLKYYKGCFHVHKSGLLAGCYVHYIILGHICYVHYIILGHICSRKATGHTNLPDTFHPHQNAQ